MKAILATPAGAQPGDTPVPRPEPDQILVRVSAASLNRADLSGVAAKDGKVIGMEWAGEIAGVGSAVTEWRPGDRVMCTGTGAYAEYAVTDRGRAMRIPDGIAFEEATVLMLACQTMHNAIVTAGRMQRGEILMIHGASSGVGLMGMQIGKLLGAGAVIGTSTNSVRRSRLHEFGADYALDASAPDWVEQILDATAGKGVDVIVDQVSGPAFNQTMKTCAKLGRIVNVGRLGGSEGVVDFNWHALRRISYMGVTFRTRSVDEIRDLTALMARDLSAAIADRRLRLPIDRVFPLEQAAAALDRMSSNAHFGKIVLSVPA
ncbi:zinc-binding dehydrogenase [Paraburkholderia sp. MM6662-R1]|uniref:zinc-binding dehydrogenase n=1 Tax=Paraburkholderia sp. MM6662-R1 TaxID=2991066 RepID=UPI003D252F11